VAPDIVHSHVVVYGMHMSGLGIPSVTTVHGVYFREAALATGALRLGALVHVPMFRRALARLRFIICISPHVAEELRPHTKAVFFHVPNPVDPAFFALNAEAAREDRVLYVGHLRPEKGTVPLVAAFERVRRTHPHAQLRLVGKPLSEAYAREIDATVRRLGLQDAVVRTGPLGPDSGLLAEFERARVLALPSLQEVLPMVIAEAMAAGLPVVATDVGGVATMVEEGRTGLLAPCGDFGAFAAHLERLMADPALCRQMGRRGRDKAMDVYHPARVAEQTMAVYEKVLNARQGAPEAGRRGDA
jgi:glycosyltransferase involved in cell wall biosynthesis